MDDGFLMIVGIVALVMVLMTVNFHLNDEAMAKAGFCQHGTPSHWVLCNTIKE